MESERKKNPKAVAAGKAAMRARWGPQRHVDLTTLDPATAAVIRAILRAEENTTAAAGESEVPATAERDGQVDERPAA